MLTLFARPIRARAAVALLPLALAGCVVGKRGRTAPGGAATLEVNNLYPGPVDLYVVRDGTGTPVRLGQASGNRVQRFRVDANVIGGFSNVTFVAQPPVSGPGAARATTGLIVVRAGDVVRFNVTQDLRSSTVFVR